MIIHCLGCKAKGLKYEHTRMPWKCTSIEYRDHCQVCRMAEAKQVVHRKLTIREVLFAHVVER